MQILQCTYLTINLAHWLVSFPRSCRETDAYFMCSIQKLRITCIHIWCLSLMSVILTLNRILLFTLWWTALFCSQLNLSNESVKSVLNRRLAHLSCSKHQGDYYKYVLKNLKLGECVVVIDYMMKLELDKQVREIQRDWYGKRGISLHRCYKVAQTAENERSIDALDLWSKDTKKDTFFM